jgi:hypothetical protein
MITANGQFPAPARITKCNYKNSRQKGAKIFQASLAGYAANYKPILLSFVAG